jgi:hypothetical protein
VALGWVNAFMQGFPDRRGPSSLRRRRLRPWGWRPSDDGLDVTRKLVQPGLRRHLGWVVDLCRQCTELRRMASPYQPAVTAPSLALAGGALRLRTGRRGSQDQPHRTVVEDVVPGPPDEHQEAAPKAHQRHQVDK